MIKITGQAQELILNAITKERKSVEEHLYVRLSIGIG